MVPILLTLLLTPAAAAGSLTSQEIYDLPPLYYERLAKRMMHQAEGSSTSTRKRHTRPMHRCILEHRKRNVLRPRDARVVSDAKGKTYANNATDQDAESYVNSNGNSANDSEEDQIASTLLSSPWWNRIHEDYGLHSYNFIPESRRAASSVVFRLTTRRRELEDTAEMDEEDSLSTVNETISDVENVTDASSIATINSTNGDSASEGKEALVSNKQDANVNTNSLDLSDATHFHLVAATNANGSDSDNLDSNIEAAVKTKSQQANSTAIASNTNATNSTFSSHHPNENKHINDSPQSTNKVTSSKGEEYMIISGGYTDHDWKTFPVYAFPLTSSISTGSGTWIDLSPLASELFDQNSESWCKSRDNIKARDRLYQEAKYLKLNSTDPWEHADPCAPSGRMGHSSFVHKNYLYVFGGLIYDAEQAPTGTHNKEAFRLEDVPYVYRLDLAEMFEVREVDRQRKAKKRRSLEDIGIMEIESLLLEEDDDEANDTTKDTEEIHDVPNTYNKRVRGWQRIVPRVKPFESLDGMPAMAASEVLLKSINRGEMQGGMWNDKFIMYGGLRIVLSDVAGPHAASKVMKGAGFSSGGSSQGNSRIIELPLGDVWAYDIETSAFEKVTNSYGKPEGVDTNEDENEEEFVEQEAVNDDDDSWWKRLDDSMFPRPRTAHAATVVGDELVVHGGMGWDEHIDDWDGSTNWETLDDMWILNLKTLQWKRRWMFPLLLRSYHSLVGWYVQDSLMGWGKDFANLTSWEGPVVAALGGYTNGIDIFSGEEVAYVFDNVIVSYPPPLDETNFGISSLWLEVRNPDAHKYSQMIGNRFEHTAVISQEGSMFIWGGQFQDTVNVKGIWMLNIAGKDSEVRLTLAENDRNFDDYEATLTALHTIVLMMMFLSMTLTLLLGLTQRYNELIMQQTNDDATLRAIEDFANQDFAGVTSSHTRGRGLHPQIISTLPEKVYHKETSQNDSNESECKDEEECCPICLVEYEEGDVLRVLPCNHYMHKPCVDSWLVNNPSCPSCRHSLSELVDDRPLMQLRTLRSRLASRSRRFGHYHSAWTQESTEISDDSSDGIEMVVDGPTFDIRFISTLELLEEGADGTENENQENNVNQADTSLVDTSRRSQRERTSRLARIRRNLDRMRRERRAERHGSRAVPLAEPLDEETEIS